MLNPQMFALVDFEEDECSIYCLGIDTGEEAITFRRDPDTRKTYFSVCENIDSAYRLHTRFDKEAKERLTLVRYASVPKGTSATSSDAGAR